MFSSIYLKTIYNLRFQILGWSLGVGFIAFVTMVFYNSFNQSGTEDFLNAVPDSLKPVLGSLDDFKTIPGYIGQQIFGPNGYLFAVVASVLMALSVSSSEEDDRRLQTLLAQPVTRSAVFCQKWLAVATAVGIMSLGLLGATWLGLLVVGHTADGGRLAESLLAFFIMNTVFATIAFSVAMFTGKKGLSVAIAGGYATFSLIISSLALSVDKLKFVDKFSVLHYYNTPLVMQHGLRFENIATLVGIIVVVAGIAWLQFRRRNVGT